MSVNAVRLFHMMKGIVACEQRLNTLWSVRVCVFVHRCGVSPQVSDVTQLSLTIGDLNVPLPSEVKFIGTEADRVLTLEEMAMRALHVAYSKKSKGETHTHLHTSLHNTLHLGF